MVRGDGAQQTVARSNTFALMSHEVDDLIFTRPAEFAVYANDLSDNSFTALLLCLK